MPPQREPRLTCSAPGPVGEWARVTSSLCSLPQAGVAGTTDVVTLLLRGNQERWMTITVTSLPLNNATKPALVGLLNAWNPSDAPATPITCNFSPTANPNNYFASSRQRPDDNLKRGGSPSRLTMRSRSMRRSTGPLPRPRDSGTQHHRRGPVPYVEPHRDDVR